MDFILQRAKAFAAVFATGMVPVLVKAVEQASGFDVPATWEAWILVTVTGLVVHQVPNKKI